MNTANYKPASALREHMLEGHRTSRLEAMLLFGVSNLPMDIKRLKNDGFVIKSKRVAMAKLIRRINDYTLCKVPDNLPYREIQMTEYWISR